MSALPADTPFWRSAAEGRLTYQQCRACGRRWLPASEACPSCLARDADWIEATGAARLVSWVVYHKAVDAAFAAMTPYVVAIVELEEGPRLYSNLLGAADPETLMIDQPLHLRFETREGLLLPCFEVRP